MVLQGRMGALVPSNTCSPLAVRRQGVLVASGPARPAIDVAGASRPEDQFEVDSRHCNLGSTALFDSVRRAVRSCHAA